MRKAPVVLLLLSLFAFLPAPASAADLPGGKANFVVALGSFKAGTARDNWVRLGNYQFTSDGGVRARTYLWWQRHPVARQRTGTTPDPTCTTRSNAVGQTLVRACEVLTAGGFMDSPPETRTGRYSLDGDKLQITWTDAGQAWSEQWIIATSPDGKLVRLDQAFNTLATVGYAYGSNASLSTSRSASTVRAFPGTLLQDYQGWTHDALNHGVGGAFKIGSFRTCATTTWCLTYLQPSSEKACQEQPSCPGTGGGSAINDSSLQNYIQRISSSDRRDTHWHWCTCLTRNSNGTDIESCYTGNSHVKPMMQIIDDDGAFRGWVGVEASFYPHSNNPRFQDMLSTFRVSDFR
ncbi:hypothetical protein [Lentzea sp. NEAU-D7]|uniref:hypothetical protein n=1 Tax=Lentzea sp. NEAU-D7 TaxID=2994667 RepID=UPI00224A60EF|nr:hypothetical protein [Lentzea sp. NEAU-D7]MCX2947855.1 hypothetical protein [Lentzea sp. NEAU-D7]